MKTVWKLFLGALAFSMLPQAASAQTVGCAATYCQYQGKITRAYINEDNLMLIYFEQPFDVAITATAGITGVSNGQAGSYIITDNQNYSEFLYSTALTALAAEKTVIMQFYEARSGYLKIDKIWIYQ